MKPPVLVTNRKKEDPLSVLLQKRQKLNDGRPDALGVGSGLENRANDAGDEDGRVRCAW